MNTQKYLDDIKEIKSIMNKSSKFMSLSGLSGVMAGVYSLIGAYFAYLIVYENDSAVIFINNYQIKKEFRNR